MFLYLVAVKLMSRMRGEIKGSFDRFMVYGSAALGAFAMSFSSSTWDNSIEAEVYSLGMFFVAIIIWLAMRWWERADEPRSERYLMMIAYLHLLGPALFDPDADLFRNYDQADRGSAPWRSDLLQGSRSSPMLDGDAKLAGQRRSGLLPIVPIAMIAAAIWFAWKSPASRSADRRRVLTYTVVLIRATSPTFR